jgi:4-amino-4-deoxychorismate lyase
MRLDNSFQTVFQKSPDWKLEFRLHEEVIPSVGLYKCRVVYDDKQVQVTFEPYKPKQIQTLKLVVDNAIEYNHKWVNRDRIEHAYAQRGDCDDLLMRISFSEKARTGLRPSPIYCPAPCDNFC